MKTFAIFIIAGITTAVVVASGYFRQDAPFVSVVMSTYNRSGRVSVAIDSILSQSFSDYEFIIIDDGSSDDTAEVLRSYMQKDKRIKVITHKQNKGLVTGLNEGLDAARGKYIVRMDDDDYSLPGRLERQVKFMEEHPEFAAAGSLVVINDGSVADFQNEADPEKNKILLYCGKAPVSHPSLILRKDFLTQHHIRYSDKYQSAEDMGFYRDIVDNGGRITVMQEALLQYNLHYSNGYDYYHEQELHVNLFSGEMLRRFMPEAEMKRYDLCACLNIMAEHGENNRYVGKKTLEMMIEQHRCRK